MGVGSNVSTFSTEFCRQRVNEGNVCFMTRPHLTGVASDSSFCVFARNVTVEIKLYVYTIFCYTRREFFTEFQVRGPL
jgi:hypothetical protein